MSILENALDSIAIGLEDFNSKDKRRIVSATRNVFAGMLLLFKHKLSELSPKGSDEVLIKQNVSPSIDDSGNLSWTAGRSKKTVDVQNIETRFNSLGVKVDWNRLKKINSYRNNIEHYYDKEGLSHDAIKKLISESFIVIRDFISSELKRDPRELLGDDSWAILISSHEVYESEKKKCNESIKSLPGFFSDKVQEILIEGKLCEKCGSDLIGSKSIGNVTDATFECRSCGNKEDYSKTILNAVNNIYGCDPFLAAKDGGVEELFGECPSCLAHTYIVTEDLCPSCGASDLSEDCFRCGDSLSLEEISDGEGLCSYCAHMSSKVMRE